MRKNERLCAFQRKRSWNYVVMLACTLLFGLLFIKPLSLDAATAKVVSIKTGEEEGCGLSGYDIDGDGKSDTLKVYDYYKEVDNEGELVVDSYGLVTLNGKDVLHFSIDEEFYGFSAKLVVLKNGKKYLFLHAGYSEYTSINTLYQYSEGSFVRVKDLDNHIGPSKYGTQYCVSSLKVSGNTLSVYTIYNSDTIGQSIIKYNYVYKKGKLSKSPSYGWVTKITQKKSGKCFNSNTLVTNKSLKAYKSATSNKTYKTIKKGKKVKVDRISYSSKYGMRIRVKYNKKYMWIKCSASKTCGYFKYIYHDE